MEKGYSRKFSLSVLLGVLIVFNSVFLVNAEEHTVKINSHNQYLQIEGKNLHIVLYGEMDMSGVEFAHENKENLVMLPALGVPSPNIYYKPLAEELASEFNITVIEPSGMV